MDETPGQKWRREMDELKAKQKAVGLTKEEEDKLQFMQDKWDDWASDIRVGREQSRPFLFAIRGHIAAVPI